MAKASEVASWADGFGKRLSVLVTKLGGNAQAAKIAGLSDEMISRYLNGKARPNVFTVAMLAREAEISLDWLMFGDSTGRTLDKAVETQRFFTVLEAVKATYQEAAAEASEVQIGEDAARIFGQVWDMEDEAEFRGGLKIALNALRRTLES